MPRLELRLPRWKTRIWVILSALAFAIAAYVAVWQFAGLSRVKPIRMTAGNSEGLRHALLVALARDALPHGLPIDVVTTSGSLDACKKVDTGEVDLAFVLGGHDFSRYPRLRQAASLHIEPAHLLVKSELYDAVAGDLRALKGKRISLGAAPGVPTYWLAIDLLEMAGLEPAGPGSPGDYVTETERHDITEKTRRDELPDALFVISTIPATVVQLLVAKFDFRIVPLPFGETFAQRALLDRAEDSPTAGPGVIRHEYIYDAVIPAYTYGIDPPVPERAIHTLGMRVLLVARDDTSADLVKRALAVIYQTRFARLVRPPLSPQDVGKNAEAPLHPGTLAFIRENERADYSMAVDRLEKIVTISAPTIGGIIFLRQWLRQRARVKRNHTFMVYIQRVTEVEERALRLELGSELDFGALLYLQCKLGALKTEALKKFAEGAMGDETLLNGFLTHVNDARAYLTRLILHERENIEQHHSPIRLEDSLALMVQPDASRGASQSRPDRAEA